MPQKPKDVLKRKRREKVRHNMREYVKNKKAEAAKVAS